MNNERLCKTNPIKPNFPKNPLAPKNTNFSKFWIISVPNYQRDGFPEVRRLLRVEPAARVRR